jgi:hypothetical protein
MLDKKHGEMPAGEGFRILRDWKTFGSSLWRMTPERLGADGPVFVADLSEGERSLALDFSGEIETLSLTGARFESVPPEDVTRTRFAPGQIVRSVLISLPDGDRLLLLEEAPGFTGEPVM